MPRTSCPGPTSTNSPRRPTASTSRNSSPGDARRGGRPAGASGRGPLVRIGAHQVLVFGSTAVGLWVGALGTALLLVWAGVHSLAGPLAIAAGAAGASTMYFWATRRVAARCPSCGGRAYYEV